MRQMTRPGLEPGISGSGGRRLIHEANGPANIIRAPVRQGHRRFLRSSGVPLVKSDRPRSNTRLGKKRAGLIFKKNTMFARMIATAEILKDRTRLHILRHNTFRTSTIDKNKE